MLSNNVRQHESYIICKFNRQVIELLAKTTEFGRIRNTAVSRSLLISMAINYFHTVIRNYHN